MSDLILLADDDELVLDTVGDLLELSGYKVWAAKNKDKMISGMQKTPDLILLDIDFGDHNGFEIALEIRKTSNVPIIMLTGKNSEPDRVVGLELGADDYITKPFGTAELLARIKAVLRRSKMTPLRENSLENNIAEFDGWKCDVDRRMVISPEGNPVKLTSGEFNLLVAFLKSNGRTLSREYLLDLTGREDSFDRSIDIQVLRLRKKLSLNGDKSKPIQSVRSVGYVFTAKVVWI